MPIILGDIRMGGLGWEMYFLDLSNKLETDLYEKTLDKPTVDLPCGRQSIIFCLSNIASEASQIITQINNNEPYKKILKRSMNNYMFLSK